MKKDEAPPADTAAAMAPAPAPMDTGMKVLDSAAIKVAMVKDSITRDSLVVVRSRGFPVPAPPPGASPPDADSALESELKKLRPAKVSFDSPDTLAVDQPEKVSVVITPKASATSPNTLRRHVIPDTTRVSKVTQVCLTAAGFRVQNEAGEEKTCRDQLVSLTKASTWSWILTALPSIKVSGPRPVMLTVNALVPGFSPYTVYTSTHTAYVRVIAPSFMERAREFLDDWRALLLSVAAIAGVIWKFIDWWKSRRNP